MAMVITPTEITSDKTAHTARRDPDAAPDSPAAWTVTWLPMRALTVNQAVTAMTLAEVIATRVAPTEDDWWTAIEDWAGELGLNGRQVVELTRLPS